MKGKLIIQADQSPQLPHQTNTPPNNNKEKNIKKKSKRDKNRHTNQHQQQPQQKIEEEQAVIAAKEKPLKFYKQQKIAIASNKTILQSKENDKLIHIAICFPDSIIEVSQTSALRAYFISQIARISCIFKVDEIIILKDQEYTSKSQKFIPSQYIARNLQYLQTPQYLRKHLFKMHPDLNNVGLMNPIEALHHLKSDEKCEFREGVTLQRPTKSGAGSWVDVGLKQQVRMDHLLLPLTRVTLRLKNYLQEDATFFDGQAVSKKIPRGQKGMYWGYDVRIAQDIDDVIQNGNYDLSIVCSTFKQEYALPSIQDFTNIDLNKKSILIYFPRVKYGIRDQTQKGQSKEGNRFDYLLMQQSYGVKQLRIQQEIFLTLSKLIRYTQ